MRQATDLAGSEVHRVDMIMGLPVSILVRDRLRRNGSHDAIKHAIAAAFAVMRGFDRCFSPYRGDSTLNAVKTGDIHINEAGSEFAEMLVRSQQAKALTCGAFDVYFAGDLEPSGLVKGWAAEVAGAQLAGLGLDWYLNAGGDITCAATDEPWRFGIEHPLDPSGLITVVALVGGGLATSGSAHRGAHIFDPATAAPALGVRQVSVIGPSLARADIWATAISARGSPALMSPVDQLLPDCLADGYQVFAVADSGKVYATEGFAAFQVHDVPRPEAAAFASLN